jgi:hypothetical protein
MCFGTANPLAKTFCLSQKYQFAGDGDCATCEAIDEPGCASLTSTAANPSSTNGLSTSAHSTPSTGGPHSSTASTPASTAGHTKGTPHTSHPMPTVTVVFIIIGVLVFFFGCVYLAVQRRRQRDSRLNNAFDGDYSLLDDDDDDLGL